MIKCITSICKNLRKKKGGGKGGGEELLKLIKSDYWITIV